MKLNDGFLHFQSQFWEPLHNEIKIDLDKLDASHPDEVYSLSIKRDEEYNLFGLIEGSAPLRSIEKEGTIKPGKIRTGFNLTGNNSSIGDCKIEGCYVTSQSANYSGLDTHQSKCTFVANIHFNRIIIKDNYTDSPERMVEWFLNGPNDSLVMGRVSNYIFEKQFNIKRQDASIDRKIQHTIHQSTCDYLIINLPSQKIGFHVIRVPDVMNPSWSSNIGIEYGNFLGGIPDEENRMGIREILSFIFGRQLLYVGSTLYNIDNNIINGIAVNPWSGDARPICKKRSGPPTFNQVIGPPRIEELIVKMASNYLDFRNELGLSDLLWRYWIGSRLPLGIDIPIMVSAIESLGKNWMDSMKSKNKGVYIESTTFKKLTEPEFMVIETKLKEHEFCERIMNRMRSSFQMGTNERTEFFYRDIELELGDIEKEVLRKRNSLLHNVTEMSESDIEELIHISIATKTLFNRTLLKILKYDGNYIDYTLEGCPSKDINTPSGE